MAASIDQISIQPLEVGRRPHTPPNYVLARLLAANVAESIAVPDGARYVRLSGTADFYASFQPSTANLTTNGTFAADTDWTKATGWTIAAGVATLASGNAGAISQTIATLETGRAYRLVYTVSGRGAGTITGSVGGTDGTARSTNATFTETILCGATTTLAFTGDASFDGSIDDVSVTPVAIVPGDNTTGTAAELFRLGNIEWRRAGPYAAISVVSAATPIITASFYRD